MPRFALLALGLGLAAVFLFALLGAPGLVGSTSTRSRSPLDPDPSSSLLADLGRDAGASLDRRVEAEADPGPVGASPEAVAPIVETRTLLAGEVTFVDEGGARVPPSDLVLFVRISPPKGAGDSHTSTVPAPIGRFRLEFVRREGESHLALENGSRSLPLELDGGTVSVFSARFDDALESPAELLTYKPTFPIGTTDASIEVRAPDTLDVTVVDAETGAAIGPATFLVERTVFAEAAVGVTRLLEPPAKFEVRVPGFGNRSVDLGSDPPRALTVELERACVLTVSASGSGSEGRGAVMEMAVLSAASREVVANRHALGTLDWSTDELMAGEYLVSVTSGPNVAASFVTLQPWTPVHLTLAPGPDTPVAPIALYVAESESAPDLLDVPVVVKPIHRPRHGNEFEIQNIDATHGATFGPFPTGLYEVGFNGAEDTEWIRHEAERGGTRAEVPAPPPWDVTIQVLGPGGLPLPALRLRLEPAGVSMHPRYVRETGHLEFVGSDTGMTRGTLVPLDVTDAEGRLRVRLRRLRYTVRVDDPEAQPYFGNATLVPERGSEQVVRMRPVPGNQDFPPTSR